MVSIIVAGTGFNALQSCLCQELPQAHVEIIEPQRLRRETFTAEVLIPTMTKIDGEIMDRVKGLRLIQQWGVGLEGVDIAQATKRKIAVANVPSAGTGNAESVAEWCVMAAIAISRQLAVAQDVIREGTGWGTPCGRALLGQTAGIVGLGGIGQALAVRLKPFGMRLLAIQRRPNYVLAEKLGIEWVGTLLDLPKLLSESDYVFLCLPVTEETRKIINRDTLALMPPHAYIINASRGGLIDQSALLERLANRKLGGAALDVFEEEPLDPKSSLLQCPNVLATPHIAGVTDRSYRGIANKVAENIRRLIAGKPPLNCVNWQEITNI